MTQSAPDASTADTSTRQRILDAALDLFARSGFAGTSMRALARAVGLRESSIYNHFTGKEAIYRTLLDQGGPAVFTESLQSEDYRRLAGDPEAFFKRCAADLLTRWLDRRDRQIMAIVQNEPVAFPGAQDRFHHALYVDENELLAEYFGGFADADLIRRLDTRETARSFTAGFVFLRMEHFAAGRPHSSREVLEVALDRYVQNFLAMVRP